MMKKYSLSTKTIIILILSILPFIIGFIYSLNTSSNKEYLSEAINISGSQRMRTMLISNYYLQLFDIDLVKNTDKDNVVNILKSEIEKYNSYYLSLIQGNDKLELKENPFLKIKNKLIEMKDLIEKYSESALNIISNPQNINNINFITDNAMKLKDKFHEITLLFQEENGKIIGTQKILDIFMISFGISITFIGLYFTKEIHKKEKESERDKIMLSNSERKNRMIVETLPDLIFRVNKNNFILDVVGDEDKLYKPFDKIINKKIDEVLPLDVSKKIEKGIKISFEEKDMKIVEYKLKVPYGLIYFEARIVNSSENEAFIYVRDISEKVEYQRKIEYLSFHDHLTGLYNRRYLEDSLNEYDKKTNLPISLFVIDVNKLKMINDNYGHDLGDKLLIKVAQILKNFFKNNGIISRTGGDEFVILLPNTNEVESKYLKKKLKEKTKNSYIKDIPISFAIGYSIKNGNENINNILRNADKNMYLDKRISEKSC